MRHDNHYTKLKIEPIHYSLENQLDMAQATIVKYVTRWKDKNGIRDLEAARDLLNDYIQYCQLKSWKYKRVQKDHDQDSL